MKIKSLTQIGWKTLACMVGGALLLTLPAKAILPEPGNIYYGLARGFWGQPLTPQDGAVVILRRSPTNELARCEIINSERGGANFILRPSLDNGIGARYSPNAAVAGDSVEIVISINGILYPARGTVPPIGGLAAMRELGITADDDRDGNGLSDSWELQCCGGTGVIPTADYDNDGVNNLGEFQAGTDPLDAQSALRIQSVTRADRFLTVEWTRVPGRAYGLEWKSDLGGPWLPIPASKLSGPSQNIVDVSGQPNVFLRVRLDPWWQ